MLRLKLVALIVLATGFFLSTGMQKEDKSVQGSQAKGAIEMADNDNHAQIDRLLEKLYSPSEPERELAKRQIIAFGSDAVAAIIAFLRDLAASNRIPRFQTGQEQQGQAAYENFCLLVQREGYDSPNVDAARERVFNLTITGRLSSDVIFILGKIQSEEAIRFLIKIMEDNGRNYAFGEEISALQAIGLDAVPYLINEIREIDRKVRTRSIEELELYFQLVCNLPVEPADIPEEERLISKIKETIAHIKAPPPEPPSGHWNLRILPFKASVFTDNETPRSKLRGIRRV